MYIVYMHIYIYVYILRPEPPDRGAAVLMQFIILHSTNFTVV